MSVPDCCTDEQFDDVPGQPGYLVSTCGRLFKTRTRNYVKAHWHDVNGVPKLMWQFTYRDKWPSRRVAAAVVLRTFDPEFEAGATPLYVDGNPENICLRNLEWERP